MICHRATYTVNKALTNDPRIGHCHHYQLAGCDITSELDTFILTHYQQNFPPPNSLVVIILTSLQVTYVQCK
jgi:hypothetical protein